MTAALQDVDEVDWLAVEFVCNGTPMRLEGDTLVAAVLAIGQRMTVADIAHRCGAHKKLVAQIVKDNGGIGCPLCQRTILHDDGVLRPHISSTGMNCGMSGYHHANVEQLARIRRSNQNLWRQG